MALTKNFRDTVRERAQRDPEFRLALLEEAINTMIAGDLETGRTIMRNYINATVGFPQLSKKTHIPKTSLMRMFGPSGNPSAGNLFGVIAALQKQEGVSLAVTTA
jgi:DNA-binding phage protein